MINYGEQISIKICDMGTNMEHNVSLRKTINSNKFYIQGRWFLEFVSRRNLREGTMIGMSRDYKSSNLHFFVLDSDQVYVNFNSSLTSVLSIIRLKSNHINHLPSSRCNPVSLYLDYLLIKRMGKIFFYLRFMHIFKVLQMLILYELFNLIF